MLSMKNGRMSSILSVAQSRTLRFSLVGLSIILAFL